MLKGHVQIELHNHKSGSKERIEQENLVTNALDMLTNFVVGKGLLATNNIMPIASRALGGLMIFEDPLTESASNVAFPHDNTLIGYAGQTLDTTEPERGSINNYESGPVENGYMTVWDFSTSQANGQISSMARTHYQVDSNSPFYSTAVYTPLSVQNLEFVDIDVTNRNIKYINKANLSTDGSLCQRSLSVRDYFVNDPSATDLGSQEIIDDTNFPKTLSVNSWVEDNGDYYSISGITSEPNKVIITLVKVNGSNRTSRTTYTLNVTTTLGTSAFGNAQLGWGANITLSDGIVFVPITTSTDVPYFSFYIFDLQDGTTQTKESEDMFVIEDQSGYRMYNAYQTARGTNGTMLVSFQSYADSRNYITFLIKSDGSYKRYSRVTAAPGELRYCIYKDIFAIGIGTSQYFRILANYLGTICNIAQPFEKTSTTTMKVKYTLTNV